MEGISNIRITGLDPLRPPRIRKEPYIDLYFQLSHKPPLAWCQDFNEAIKKSGRTARIKAEEGQFIDCWVRKPEEIPELLEQLKQAVKACSAAYIARIDAASAEAVRSAAEMQAGGGEQNRLNQIIAALKFDA